MTQKFAAATPCAGTNTIAALLAGAIDGAAAQELELHLDACATCRRMIADLGRGLSAIGEAPGAGGALPQVGETVGRFEVVRVIGVGGMGVVFEARDPMLGRRVAVKLLRPDIAAGGALLDEAQAMARLQHANVAVVHDVGRHGGQLYVCMEYIAGATLRGWLGERARSWREIVEVMRAAGRGLAYVHAAGLVHRDFKPDNVMIGRDGRVVVMDFGLARMIGRDVRGLVVGTPAYMAPEQRRGARVDARADQYAFCVALREAVGGRAPAWLARAIARGCAPHATDRFTTMDELLASIDARLARPSRAVRRIAAATTLAAAAVAAIGFARTPATVTEVVDRRVPVIERVTEPASAAAAMPVGSPDDRAASAPAEPPRVSSPIVAARAPSAHPVAAWPSQQAAAALELAPLGAPPSPPRPMLPAIDVAARGGGASIAASPGCDDGSERRCPRAEPICPSGTIAAVQASCWTCADERTCAPVVVTRGGTGGAGGSGGAGGAGSSGGVGSGNGVGSGGGAGPGSGFGSDATASSCGNGFCEDGEDHANCPSDCCATTGSGACEPVCGNGFCEIGEDPASCPDDCG